MSSQRCELDLARLAPQARRHLTECLTGRGLPRPIWLQPAPVDESWKLLLPVGAVLLIVMALVGGDTVLGWPWVAGWLLAGLPLGWGVFGWLVGRKNAARLGFPPGVFVFASDLIDARDGVCALYNLDALTQLNPKGVYRGATMVDSELEFEFGHEVVTIRVPGKATAQLTIDKFWPAREALLLAIDTADWDEVAALDPLYEPRYLGGWEKVCRPSTTLGFQRTTIDAKVRKGLLGMPPLVMRWGAIAALVAAPLLWMLSNSVRETLAFSRARSRDTVAGWKQYLERDSARHVVEARQEYLPRAALRAAKKDGSAAALREFLANYENTPVAPEAQVALHAVYAKAIEQAKAEVAAPARDAVVNLLRWLDAHRTNVVEVRFGASSAAEMSALDEFIELVSVARRLTVPIAPIGPSLAPEIIARREAELIDAVKAGFLSTVPADLVRFERGGAFSGTVTAFDQPALAITCFAEPSPQLFVDRDSRKLFLRLSFNCEFNLVVPGSQPYTSTIRVDFVDRMPLPQARENYYDAMVAHAYEEVQHSIAASLFPKHLPARKVKFMELREVAPETSGPMFTATGFCISPEGYIATAHHFTSRAKTFKIVTKTGPVEAKLVVADEKNDLAILKVPGEWPVSLALRPSESVKLGESVATIGFPQTDLQGRAPKIGKGEIASLAGLRDDPTMFQVSVPIQPGNSGGPLLDLRGNVVGVVAGALQRAQAVNYAVKSSYLATLSQRIPELRNLASPTTETPPAFEDMIDRVRQATVLIEGYE